MADTARHRVTQPRLSLGVAGLLPAIVKSWAVPHRVVRGLSGMGDPALLAVLLGAMTVFLIAQVPVHLRAAAADPSVPVQARIGGAVLSVMFLMPLVAYGVAAVSVAVMRVVRVRITGRHGRLALFWALLAVSPAMVLSGVVQGQAGPGAAFAAVQALAGTLFLWIWGAGIVALRGMNDVR